jgi:hypothetical protein
MASPHRIRAVLLAAVLLSACLSVPASAAQRPVGPRGGAGRLGYDPHWMTGRVAVRWKPGTDRATREAVADRLGATTAGAGAGPGVELLRTSDPRRISGTLIERGDVVWAEPEIRFYPNADAVTDEAGELDTEAAWNADDRMTGDGVEIAVIDEGVASDNPDLDGPGKVVDGGDCSSGTCAATGGTTVDPDENVFTHGTAVATAAAGEADGSGMAGVAPAATIVAYRVFDIGDSSASSSAISAALVEAAGRSTVKVINLSLGSPYRSQQIEDTIAQIRGERSDLVIVAAAGNDGGEQPDYPADTDGVLGVGASEQTSPGVWRTASFSNRGGADVLAPGVDVTVWNHGTMTTAAGTSFAAPQVAGIAAGLAAAGVTGDRARAAILASAEAPATGTDPLAGAGSGRADALTAVQTATGGDFTALNLTGGSFVPNEVGHRTLEQLRFEAGGSPDGVAGVSATKGEVGTFGTPAQESSSAGSTGSGGLTPPAGTLTRAEATYSAPGTDAGNVDAALTATGAGTTRPLTLRLTRPANGPDGVPVEHGALYSANLTYGSVSEDIHTVTLEQGDEVSLGLLTPEDADVDETAVLDVWEPETADGTGDTTEPPSETGGWYGEGVVTYVAPRDGRYAFGYKLFETGGNGLYKLRVTCASCANPVGSVTAAPSPFSPTGDGVRDILTVNATTSVGGLLAVEVRNGAGALVRTLFSGSRAAGTLATTWNGNDAAGKPVATGTYRVTARHTTADGDSWARTVPAALDRTRPAPVWMRSSAATVFPYPDHYLDTVDFSFKAGEALVRGRFEVRNAAGTVVWTYGFGALGAGAVKPARFAGKTTSGKALPGGRYSWSLSLTDQSGLVGGSPRSGLGIDRRRMR